jgi:hypothetical protein
MRFFNLLLLILALFFGGCCSKRYDTSSVGVGYSAMLNELGELDIKENLDVSRLPDMLNECYKEGLSAKKKGDELQRHVVQSLSQKIREISTLDLDGDGFTDPILVLPDGDDEYMTFSIRAPDPEVYGQGKKPLPDLKDAAAWQKLAEEEAVELVTLTAAPQIENGQVKSLNYEARPSTAYYGDSHYYHHSSGSGVNGLLTYLVVRDMFYRPRWYGPSYYGWYGGYYRPYTVGHVYSNRTTTVNRYSSGKTSYGRLRTSSGRIPPQSKSSELASRRSFSSANTVRQKVKTGGFGRSSSTGTSKSGGFGRSSTKSSTAKKSSGGWFSGSSSRGRSSGGFRRGK